MFVLSRDVSAAYKVIATLVAVALVLYVVGTHSLVQAANITVVSDTLSDSAPGVGADHTIVFTSPSGIPNGATTSITFPAEFIVVGVDSTDIDMASTSDYTVAADCTGAEQVGASFVGTTLELVFCAGDGGSLFAGGTTTIQIGQNADGGGANAQITNPATPQGGNESFEIDISAGASDSGHTRVVILDTVLVTAVVNTVFDFTVYGNATGTAVNGTTTTGGTGTTTIPFGELLQNQVETLSQDLTVGTNARNGFVVTVETDGQFESSTGADIDVFDDGVISAVPATWSIPFNDILDENTWGHWGITSEDATTTRANEFGSNEWVGVSTAPIVIFSHDGPADETTPGIGSTTVGFQVQITALQEAGDDYETVLTYIATPTF